MLRVPLQGALVSANKLARETLGVVVREPGEFPGIRYALGGDALFQHRGDQAAQDVDRLMDRGTLRSTSLVGSGLIPNRSHTPNSQVFKVNAALQALEPNLTTRWKCRVDPASDTSTLIDKSFYNRTIDEDT